MAIGAVLASGAIAGAELAANYIANKKSAQQNQKYARENMEHSFLLSQQAQRNAASNEVAGLRAAGLSPALANGAAAASFSPGQPGTEQPVRLDAANKLLLFSQLKNLDAQTQKTQAETQNIVQSTGERQVAGSTWSVNLHQYFMDLASKQPEGSEKQKYYQDLAQEAQEAGVLATGAGDALKAFNQLEAESYETRERIIKARLTALIDEAQWKEASRYGDFLEDLRDMPRRQSNLLAAQIAKFAADKNNLEALAALATSQKNLNEQQIQQVKAMTERLESYNLPALIKKGDAKGFLAALLGLLIEGVASHPVMAR